MSREGSRLTEVATVIGKSGLSSLGTNETLSSGGVRISSVGAVGAEETMGRISSSLTRAARSVSNETETRFTSGALVSSKGRVGSSRTVFASDSIRRESTGKTNLAVSLVNGWRITSNTSETLFRARRREGTRRAKLAGSTVGREASSLAKLATTKVWDGCRTFRTEITALRRTSDLTILARTAVISWCGGMTATTVFTGVGGRGVTSVGGAVLTKDVDIVKNEDLSFGAATETDIIKLEKHGTIKELRHSPLEIKLVVSRVVEKVRDVEGIS